MIETYCACGKRLQAAETTTNVDAICEGCGKSYRFVCAEDIAGSTGNGDFDTRLTIVSGPSRGGAQHILGGVSEIACGKQADRHIALPGTMVSRLHCKFERVDFGPSRWNLVDNRSTNGVFVNGTRIIEPRELRSGDLITVGEYEVKFETIVAPPPKYENGRECPSCGASHPGKAKICVTCGVDLTTGRSIVISKGLDEDALAIRADTWIRVISWIIPFGLFPIASEALGTNKARVTWILFAATGLISTVFLILYLTAPGRSTFQYANLMLWSGDPEYVDPEIRELIRKLNEEMKNRPATKTPQPPQRPVPLSPPPVATNDEEYFEEDEPDVSGEFRWYQLFTHALLHGGIMHFAGNMVFLLVFGLRVNELIGDAKMVIVYPLLAAISGAAHYIASRHGPVHPMLGASGAIMGLAGMYFVFFPKQRVHMSIWFRGGLLTGWRVFYKVFTMPGFWLLVAWIVLNDVLFMYLLRNQNGGDGVAHWAHLGGFLGGMTLALLLLISRLVYARGGDLLSAILGRRAWMLIGKPR